MQICTGRLIRPFGPKARNRDDLAVAPREIVRLLAARRVLPFVVARSGNETAPLLEGITKHRLLSNRLRTGVKGREPHFLERLAPPVRD